MVDRTFKRLQAMLIKMAHDDPNEFLKYLYHSGMETADIEELYYLVAIARRAKGYQSTKDLLLQHGIV